MKLTMLERREFSEYLRCYPFWEALRDKTFLITGAGGMTGSGIIKWLLLENELHDANIRIYASTRDPERASAHLDPGDRVTYYMSGMEEQALKDASVDYVIHGAAPTGRAFFMSNPVETFRVIVDMTERLLELACHWKGCRFLYLSSMDVYGAIRSERPVTEEVVSPIDSLCIRNGYPLGKKAGEFLCRAYYEEYGVDTVMIRPASIQGLLQPYCEGRVFNEILQCIIEKRDLVLKSDGSAKKCFLYSLDAIAAILTVLAKGMGGEAYNATNPQSYMAVKDLAERIFERYCPDLKIQYDIQDIKTTGFLPSFSFVQDNSKLEALGWKPLKSPEDVYAVDIERFLNQTGS